MPRKILPCPFPFIEGFDLREDLVLTGEEPVLWMRPVDAEKVERRGMSNWVSKAKGLCGGEGKLLEAGAPGGYVTEETQFLRQRTLRARAVKPSAVSISSVRGR
jgi:hypothetical protein